MRRGEREKGTAVEGRRRKEKEEANPTADDWTGQCVRPLSSERIRLLHGQVHGLSPARLNRRASAVRQNRKGCEQRHVTGWNSLTTAWALYGDAGHGPSTGEPFFFFSYIRGEKERASFRIRLFHFPF